MSKTIIAAGGIVLNPKNEILWIFRRGFWDLPKGKLDAGEQIEDCAIREVEEETGIQQIHLKGLVTTTLHEYFDTYMNEPVTKKTYWYLMSIDDIQNGVPQYSEDIEKIEWNTLEDSTHCLANTYDTINDVIKQFEGQQ